MRLLFLGGIERVSFILGELHVLLKPGLRRGETSMYFLNWILFFHLFLVSNSCLLPFSSYMVRMTKRYLWNLEKRYTKLSGWWKHTNFTIFSASQTLISAERRVSDIVRDSVHPELLCWLVYTISISVLCCSAQRSVMWGILLPHLGSGSANAEKIPECSGNFQAVFPAVALKIGMLFLFF